MFVHGNRKPTGRLAMALAAGLAALALVLPASAQAPDPSGSLPERLMPGLEEILATALSRSPQMIQREIEVDRAEAARVNARSPLYPSVNGNARYAYEGISTTNSPSTTGQGFFYTFWANYPVYRWGEIKAGVEIGEIGLRIARRQYAEAYRDLASSVRGKFMRLAILRRSLLLRERSLAFSETLFARDMDRIARGELPPGNKLPLELGRSEALIARDRERFDYEAAKRAFLRLSGAPSLDEERIPEMLPKPAVEEGQLARILGFFDQSGAAERLPGVENARDQIRMGDLRLRIASVRLRPKLELSASSSLDNQAYLSGTGVSQTATFRHQLGLVANWSVFDGFATRSAKLDALAGRRQAEQQLAAALSSLDEQRRVAAAQFDFALRALGLAERRHSGDSLVRHLEEELKAGRATADQLEQAKLDLLRGEIALMTARMDVYMAWSELLGVLGMDPALNKVPAPYLRHGH